MKIEEIKKELEMRLGQTWVLDDIAEKQILKYHGQDVLDEIKKELKIDKVFK